MADISFKISGDTPTFVARIYLNSERSTLCHENFVDTSGTCVTFGMLQPSTCYYYSVCDSIGNEVTGTTLTPPNNFSTICKTIDMCGDMSYSSNYPCWCSTIIPNNKIFVNPSLSVGETVDLCFSVNMCGCNRCDDYIVSNAISVFHKKYGETTSNNCYTKVTHLDCVESLPPIRLSYGDEICYNVSTNQTQAYSSITTIPFSKLSLTLGSSTGFVSILGCSCKCTSLTIHPQTTSPTTVQPIYVSLCPVAINNTNPYCQKYCSKICTTPDLGTNESFRLCFTNSASSQMDEDNPRPISSAAYICYNGSKICCAHSSLSSYTVGGSNYNSDSLYGYIDINSSNCGDYIFIVDASSSIQNGVTNHATSSSAHIKNTIPQVNPDGHTFYIDSAHCSFSATVQVPPTWDI